MRYRALALFPLVYAGVFASVAWWLADSSALEPFVRWQLILVRVLAIVGCFAAVSAFHQGDHLRRAWSWLAVATVLVLVRDLIRLFATELPPPGEWTISGLGVASNLALLAGIWMLASAWKTASISLPGGRGGAVTVAVVTAVIALAVAGPFALEHLQSVRDGNWEDVVLLASGVVDILALCLLAPLLLTTISLRGGLFAWPWGLVTASMLCWLFYDLAVGLGMTLASESFPLNDLFRGMAENYLFVAGVAQRFAIQQVHRAAR